MPSKNPLQVGNRVLIRTVTNYNIGQIVEIDEHYIVLEDAAWIPSVGRWYDAMKTGTLDEVEPHVGAVAISRAALVDAVEWRHNLPKAQK